MAKTKTKIRARSKAADAESENTESVEGAEDVGSDAGAEGATTASPPGASSKGASAGAGAESGTGTGIVRTRKGALTWNPARDKALVQVMASADPVPSYAEIAETLAGHAAFKGLGAGVITASKIRMRRNYLADEIGVALPKASRKVNYYRPDAEELNALIEE